MSAIVVPTAADLASGLRFVDDRIVVAPQDLCLRPWQPRAPNDLPYCKTGAAAAQSQLEGSIRAFHLIRKQCIATGGQDAYGLIPTGQPADLCGRDGLTSTNSRQSSVGRKHYEWDLWGASRRNGVA